ncbi:helix-turn-helix domain-containing protein [Kangiella spongicola]|uniref:Transcriptional regulator n=1 Tax=Kangiella spongicola TaxID=796379 RepID=A0A318D928_9GAMM|nr:helix-turn-helix transcriptional regulator [Kangiella spongicola]PXF62639.1 transcriptional regulator [Kangiella spongicola]
MTLGEKLRSLRSTSGWTQPEFAKKLGIEQSYLSKLENDRSIPSVEIFDKLCTAYEITPDDMIKDLDKDYVRQKLMHIPIIANATNSKHEVAKGKRKAAVIVCSTFILVAVLFFFTAYLELLSSNKQWEYRSLGIDFKHEINQCLKKQSRKECYIKFTGNFFENSFPTNTRSQHPESIITKEYKGEAFIKKLDKGFREYHAKQLEDKRSTANNIFLIFAVFLMTLGILGLIVEARFYRIDKTR